MRILITGACGFAGKKLAHYLADKGHEVLATGRPEDAGLEKSAKAAGLLKYRQLDILDTDSIAKVFTSFTPEAVYHLAAITFIPAAEKDFEATLSINVAGTENLLSAIKKYSPSAKFIFASSGEIYGKADPAEIPLTESATIKPANRYSLTKIMAEQAVIRYMNYEGLNAVIFRLFNHTGAGQAEQMVIPSFASQLARIARKEQPPLIKVGNLAAYRDFTNVKDVLRAYELAAAAGKGIYNICSGKSVQISWLLTRLIEIAGIKVEVEVDPERFRPIETPEICGSNKKALQDLGWEPKISIEDTLLEVWNSYK